MTVYDYGQGGVWTWIRAESADAVRRLYPELQIIEGPPTWVDDEPPVRTVDLTDDEDPFLAALRRERS